MAHTKLIARALEHIFKEKIILDYSFGLFFVSLQSAGLCFDTAPLHAQAGHTGIVQADLHMHYYYCPQHLFEH